MLIAPANAETFNSSKVLCTKWGMTVGNYANNLFQKNRVSQVLEQD